MSNIGDVTMGHFSNTSDLSTGTVVRSTVIFEAGNVFRF